MSDCILWTGTLTKDGYGNVYDVDRRRSIGVHRMAFEGFYGPIPKGMLVRHICDVRNCYNPLHLELGSHADNMRDCVERDRHARSAGGKRHPKVDMATVVDISSRVQRQYVIDTFI